MKNIIAIATVAMSAFARDPQLDVITVAPPPPPLPDEFKNVGVPAWSGWVFGRSAGYEVPTVNTNEGFSLSGAALWFHPRLSSSKEQAQTLVTNAYPGRDYLLSFYAAGSLVFDRVTITAGDLVLSPTLSSLNVGPWTKYTYLIPADSVGNVTRFFLGFRMDHSGDATSFLLDSMHLAPVLPGPVVPVPSGAFFLSAYTNRTYLARWNKTLYPNVVLRSGPTPSGPWTQVPQPQVSHDPIMWTTLPADSINNVFFSLGH